MLSQVIPNEKNTEIIYGQVSHYDVGKLPKRYNKNTRTNNCTVEESCEGLSAIDERIYTMHFSFDTLNILPKCQQAELLFSMFADGKHFLFHETKQSDRDVNSEESLYIAFGRS